MKMKDKAPILSFQCPKLWRDMPGSETKRFCEECRHQVQNLSLLSEEERSELFQRAKTERVCGTYYRDLDGNLVTADSEASLTVKIRALRLAAFAGSAVALASCAKEEEPQLVGLICAPDENHEEPAMPATGPTSPPHPDGLLGDFSKKESSPPKE